MNRDPDDQVTFKKGGFGVYEGVTLDPEVVDNTAGGGVPEESFGLMTSIGDGSFLEHVQAGQTFNGDPETY